MVKPPLATRWRAPASPAHARADARRHCLLAAAGLALPLLLPGCSSSKPPGAAAPGAAAAPPPVLAPAVLAATLSAAPNLNPSISQRASPLAMRLYELRTSAAFGKADFMALYQGDLATLGAELVVRDEFVLAPGETRPYPRTLSGETRFIGVLGIYRDIERAVWRAVFAVQPGRQYKLLIRAEALAVSITAQP